MTKTFLTTVTLAALAIFASSAQVGISIHEATIQNGQVSIAGTQAQRDAAISWEGVALGIDSNSGGVFRFNTAVLPPDCVGRLKIGTEELDVVINNCTANITIYQAGVPKTGQTISHAIGDDGYHQKGVAFPNPRYTDNQNGTVTDNLTGLIWLKDAGCLGQRQWLGAIAAVDTLADGRCGLTDGSSAGDWRLPNINEIRSLADVGRGTALAPGHPFTNVDEEYYWSSTSYANISDTAWSLRIGQEGAMARDDKTRNDAVTAVRGGPVMLR